MYWKYLVQFLCCFVHQILSLYSFFQLSKVYSYSITFILILYTVCKCIWLYRGLNEVLLCLGPSYFVEISGISNSVIIISVIMSLPLGSSSPHTSCSPYLSHWQSLIIRVISHGKCLGHRTVVPTMTEMIHMHSLLIISTPTNCTGWNIYSFTQSWNFDVVNKRAFY